MTVVKTDDHKNAISIASCTIIVADISCDVLVEHSNRQTKFNAFHDTQPMKVMQQVNRRRVKLLVELHLRATGCHLPYGITQCYLPTDISEHTPL